MTPSNLLRTALSAALCLFVLAIAVGALTACGGGGGDGGNPPAPAPAANADPSASFAAPAGGTAGQALAFDGSASADADGDALTFSWDFGDGSHGGGTQLAHVYPNGGSFTVTLTVADGRGGTATTTRSITVSAPPPLSAATPSVTLVSDAGGPLQGVSVTVLETSASATTGSDGKANIAIATGAPVTLKFSKGGYADQFKSLQLQSGATGTQIAVHMLAREGAMTLADAAAGGTLSGKQGATLAIPAGALVDAAGNAVSGAVQAAITPVDVAADVRAFPGLFQGLRASGARGLIESYGTVEYVLTQSGAPLQVAPGQKVTIDIPIYTGLHRDGSAVAAGQVIPLWSLDERTAAWVQEGTGTVVASAASPSGFALRAQVSHLSWWNCDQWLGSIPDGSYNPDVRCCIRDTPDGPCKENSGDICEHTGSGPTSGGSAGGNAGGRAGAALQRALREQPRQAPGAQRVPAVAAFATAPAITGAVLPMPADMDITLQSSARNGTYRGTRVLRGGAGVSEVVTVSVLPVASGGNDEPITLPWSQSYAMQSSGEVDRYKLTMPSGPGFEVYVSGAGSNLGGTLKVTRPDGSVVATQNFGVNAAYVAEATVASAGVYTIEVTAGSNAPGAYKLEAASFGNCSSVQALTLPFEGMVDLAPNQSRCFDVSLAADEVIRIVPIGTHNHVAGSVALSTALGVQQIAARAYPGPAIVSGVAVAGSYRVRVTNTTLNTGKLEMTITKPAVQGVLAVPGTRTVTGLGPGAPNPLFLLKPPADGLYQVSLAAGNLQAGVQIEPAGTTFVTGCASCSNANVTTEARALRHAGPGLPVAQVFYNAGFGDTVELSTGVPTLINRDVDIDGAPGNGLRVYAFDANAGDVIAYRIAQPAAAADLALFSLKRPSGDTVPSAGAVTLPEDGLYSAMVGQSQGGAFGAHTLRFNTAPPVQPLPLGAATTTVPFDLPLGQVLRYSVDLTQGELVGLSLATPGSLNVGAGLANPVVDGHVSTPGTGSGPFDVASPPSFVRAGGSVILTVRGNTGVLERARGNGNTLRVHKPAPATAAINAAQTGNLAVGAWTSYRYTVPASGRYLLYLASTAPAPYSLAATVWAASSVFSNYSGEFASSAALSFTDFQGLGLLPAGTYTVTVRNSHAAAAASYAVGLVDLEAPTALAINGAQSTGTVDSAGERDYASFDATAGQAFTLRTTAAFAGTVRVRKLVVADQWAIRNASQTIPGMPVALSAGVQSVFTFTIPSDLSFGSGTYVVEVAPDPAATGGHTMQLSSP